MIKQIHVQPERSRQKLPDFRETLDVAEAKAFDQLMGRLSKYTFTLHHSPLPQLDTVLLYLLIQMQKELEQIKDVMLAQDEEGETVRGWREQRRAEAWQRRSTINNNPMRNWYADP